MEESTVTSDLLLFVKINALTWSKVCVCERENKRANVQRRENKREVEMTLMHVCPAYEASSEEVAWPTLFPWHSEQVEGNCGL